MHLLSQLTSNFHERRYTTVDRTAGGVKDGEIVHREYYTIDQKSMHLLKVVSSKINV